MATFDDLLLEARPGLKECPDFTILDALRRSSQEFCRETEAWTEDLDPIIIRSGLAVYDIGQPSGSLLERVKVARISGDDHPLRNVHIHDIRAAHQRNGGVTVFAVTGDGAAIELYGTPEESDTGRRVTLTAVLSPTRAARTLPNHVANRWHDAIVAGAQAILQRIPGMAWTNPAAAALNQSIFDDEKAKARRVYMTGHGVQQRLRLNPFA